MLVLELSGELLAQNVIREDSPPCRSRRLKGACEPSLVISQLMLLQGGIDRGSRFAAGVQKQMRQGSTIALHNAEAHEGRNTDAELQGTLQAPGSQGLSRKDPSQMPPYASVRVPSPRAGFLTHCSLS